MPSGPDFDLKDRVKQATDIVDLVGLYINLRRQGAEYVGLCPWHQDTRPSFKVNPNRQSYVCYVCPDRGDVFDFVMKKESVDFRTALEILAGFAGIEVTRGKKVEKGSPDHKPTLYNAMSWAEDQYHKCLLHDSAAIPVRDYLSQRGITDDSVRQFRIGFAPLSWSWLLDKAKTTSHSAKILESCGLIAMSNRGSWYERFRGRVLFPIRDTQDRAIGLGGRVVPGIYGDEKEPPGKYYNSTETRLFSKSDNLYGLNLVRDHVSKTRKLTIVEGYTDVVGAWQAGLRNVVAALGTALNERHIKLIKRFADEITLVLDGDDAGQRRTNELLDLFVAQDVDLRILSLPQGADPFDFVKEQGSEAFQSLIDTAPDAISHRIRVETEGVDLVNQTHLANQALENILKTLAGVPAHVIASSAAKSLRQDQIISRLARRFHSDRDQVRRRLTELRTSLGRQSNQYRPEQEPRVEKIDYTKLDRKEKELLQLLIVEPDFLDSAVEKVAPNQFTNGPLKEIYVVMDEFFHDGRDVTYESLMLTLDDPELKGLVDFLSEEATSKKEASIGDATSISVSVQEQFDTVIAAFNKVVEAHGDRAKLSELQQKKLDEKEEAHALEELLRQARQRQGLQAPMDG